jgi:predicted RNA polymerase sigma factor
MLVSMAELPDQFTEDFQLFAARWLGELLAVFLRAVRDPALAYDLATETLAAARLRWTSAPDGPERVAWLIGLGGDVLATAVRRGRVASTERRRNRRPSRRVLTVAHQHELMRLADARLELPADAQAAADALARAAPPMHVLRKLRGSDLVGAEPLPDRVREPDER